MKEKINELQFDGEFRVCPSCGYKDGFHTMLRQDGESVKWLFICPNCHEIFDIGFALKSCAFAGLEK